MKIIKDGELFAGRQVGETVLAGRKSVTTAGTAETLVSSSTKVTQGIIIMAVKGNTGNVFVGDSTVDKDSDKQMELEPGEATAIGIDDLQKVYVDSATTADSVSWLGA